VVNFSSDLVQFELLFMNSIKFDLVALFGFSPPGSEICQSNYLLYFCSALEVRFDIKTHRPLAATGSDIHQYCRSFLIHFLQMVLLVSVLSHYAYEPFHDEISSNLLQYSWKDYIAPGHLGNNLSAACEYFPTLIQ